jgi:hypothetical protein
MIHVTITNGEKTYDVEFTKKGVKIFKSGESKN